MPLPPMPPPSTGPRALSEEERTAMLLQKVRAMG